MSFNLKEFASFGFTRPTSVHQAFGGRGGGLWHCCMLGRLDAGLKHANFLNLLADSLKAGDEVWIGGYPDQAAFRDEKAAEQARVIIFEVRKPEARHKPETGMVRFYLRDYFDIAAAQKLDENKRLAGAA